MYATVQCPWPNFLRLLQKKGSKKALMPSVNAIKGSARLTGLQLLCRADKEESVSAYRNQGVSSILRGHRPVKSGIFNKPS